MKVLIYKITSQISQQVSDNILDLLLIYCSSPTKCYQTADSERISRTDNDSQEVLLCYYDNLRPQTVVPSLVWGLTDILDQPRHQDVTLAVNLSANHRNVRCWHVYPAWQRHIMWLLTTCRSRKLRGRWWWRGCRMAKTHHQISFKDTTRNFHLVLWSVFYGKSDDFCLWSWRPNRDFK